MQRRTFLKTIATISAIAPLTKVEASIGTKKGSLCLSEGSGDGILGQSQGFNEIRHRHEFFIPLKYLVNPPKEGFTARCSEPLQGQTDFEGLKNRTNSDGSPLDLRAHAHTVILTQKQLIDLSNGYHATVDLSKFGHLFYFVADDATLKNIRKLKGI